MRTASEETLDGFDPVGNERLTAVVGIVLLILTVVELVTIPLGVHRSCRCNHVAFENEAAQRRPALNGTPKILTREHTRSRNHARR
jgi:hypothetical protein